MGKNISQKTLNLWTLIWLLTGMTSFFSIAAFGGRSWWLFELATHFRVQYFVVLTICALLFLSRKKLAGAILAGSLAIANLLIVFPIDPPVHANSENSRSEGMVLRALLANVDHNNVSYHQFHNLVETTNPDVLVLVEVNDEWMETLGKWASRYPFQKILPLKQYGLGVLSRTPFKNAEFRILAPDRLPSVIIQFHLENQDFVLVGAHPHSPVRPIELEWRNQYLNELAHLISSQNTPIVLLGDLNTTPWSPYFEDFITSTKLRDTRPGYGLGATWPAKVWPLWIPIDHCLVSSGVFIHNRQVGPEFGSDHYPLLVEFSIHNTRNISPLNLEALVGAEDKGLL